VALRVGLTGGIGSGKSEVARILRGLGANIVDADALAREVVAPGTPGFAEVASRWPEVVRDGQLDRAALATIVFSDARELAALNAIVHPRVRARAEEIERDLGDGINVHVVPLLFEGDYWKACDVTVVVVAPREQRIARVMTRDGTGIDDIERRMAAQIDPHDASRRADYTIKNDGSLSDLEKATAEVWASLQARDSQRRERIG